MIDNTIEYLCPYNSKSMLLQCFSREDYDMEGPKDLFMGEFMNSVDSLEDAASDSYDIWSSNDDKLSNTVDTNDFSFNHSFNSDISSLEEYGNSLQAKPFILASTFVDDPFDVVLSLRGNKYNLHKKVLKEKSQRFLRYFDESPMQHEFIIPSPFNKHEFKEIVNYFYGNECHLTISNVFGIMRIAHYYDVNDLLLDCENWLYKNLAEENFITAFSVAQDLEMKTLEENLVQQFQANFMIYVENKHYLNFSFKMMERIFDVYFINALDQEFLSSIILDWIDYDCDSRMSYFKWMIETVNIGDLSTNFILEIGSCYAHLFTCITFSSMYVELLDKYYGPLE